MRLKMRGERIERPFDLGVVVEPRGRAAEPRDPGLALGVVGKKAMHVGSCDSAIDRERAVVATVGKAHQRPSGVRSRAQAHMHLISPDRRPIENRYAADGGQRLFALDHGVDIEKAEALYGSPCSLDAVRLADGATKHLIAAAKPDHTPDAPHKDGNVNIPS